jgi:hypothetical protein
MVREPDATMQPTLQDNQLMSKHRVLGFKPQLRLEWRGQDGQNETKQPDHSASLGDSITSSTRIKFSVQTAPKSSVRCSGPPSSPNWSLPVPPQSDDYGVRFWLLRLAVKRFPLSRPRIMGFCQFGKHLAAAFVARGNTALQHFVIPFTNASRANVY